MARVETARMLRAHRDNNSNFKNILKAQSPQSQQQSPPSSSPATSSSQSVEQKDVQLPQPPPPKVPGAPKIIQKYGVDIDQQYMYGVCDDRAFNCNSRKGVPIDKIIVHSSVIGFKETIEKFYKADKLTEKERIGSSSHFVIDTDGKIYQITPESDRAWHAGRASWFGDKNVNSSSIGIELINVLDQTNLDINKNCKETGAFNNQPSFTPEQMKSFKSLVEGLSLEYDIPARMIAGHDMIRPDDKCDPGPAFPWTWQEAGTNGLRLTAKTGKKGFREMEIPSVTFGLKVEASPLELEGASFKAGDEGDAVLEAQKLLRRGGFTFVEENSKFDKATEDALRAFQGRYRAARVDGILDPSTVDTLKRYVAQVEQERSNREARQKSTVTAAK